jgi:hypothetical protein
MIIGSGTGIGIGRGHGTSGRRIGGRCHKPQSHHKPVSKCGRSMTTIVASEREVVTRNASALNTLMLLS